MILWNHEADLALHLKSEKWRAATTQSVLSSFLCIPEILPCCLLSFCQGSFLHCVSRSHLEFLHLISCYPLVFKQALNCSFIYLTAYPTCWRFQYIEFFIKFSQSLDHSSSFFSQDKSSHYFILGICKRKIILL